MRTRLCLVLLPFAILLPAGCQQEDLLIATPNLLRHQDPEQVFAAAAPGAQGPDMEVLYATDRGGIPTPEGVTYGYDRSRRLAFGTATVTLKPTPTWKELIADSTRAERKLSYALSSAACKEHGAFDPALDKLDQHGGGIKLASAVVADFAAQQSTFHSILSERLTHATQKDVYIFVHGYNDTFDDAVLRFAEVWHFMGRVGVPVVYSWPAGYGGLRGYPHDRESGEFTVFHLKYFLEMVASCPQVERIHLIAHSRGCDVAVSALRELHIACTARGGDTQTELKLENLVLAAPDLDPDVFMQRFLAENVLRAARRTTIYTSTTDEALELADVVFASRRRVGTLGARDFSPKVRELLTRLPNLQFIDCKVTHYSTSHDYAFVHPAALSDLILLLRDRRPPGAENGRPLRSVDGIWELTNEYPARN
jgi:esterase/lipase superfamily enzyme